MNLPIFDVLADLQSALSKAPNVVLTAPPGAGKTTMVPLSLLNESWLKGKKIVMLEPRRLAARTAAHFMAETLGESVGETVGYRVRMESRTSTKTRVEVVTEGVLTRMLQKDPTLQDVGLVIFDEFHERSLQADLGLALCLDVQSGLRDDLKILVMSATLDGDEIVKFFGNAPVVKSEGRAYPVTMHHLIVGGRTRDNGAFKDILSAIEFVFKRETGSILVFLPGVKEIRWVEQGLKRSDIARNALVAPLYGNLPVEEQDRAVAKPEGGRRKIVLATNIAETSITIEGVRVVIDSGFMQQPRFDPGSGMTRLERVQISQASANQRAGRAGRTEPGVCYRLWPQSRHLVPFTSPEIEKADLAPLVLELAQWGVTKREGVRWVTSPPLGAFKQAQTLLRSVKALNSQATITAHGRQMVNLPMHPRLAYMVLKGKAAGVGSLACELAALLTERDVLHNNRGEDRGVDLKKRVEALRRSDSPVAKHIRKVVEHWRRQLGVRPSNDPLKTLGVLLAWAYPDRVAMCRTVGGERYLLSNGRGASLDEMDALVGEEFLVAAQFEGPESNTRIKLAAAIDEAELREHFANEIREVEGVEWDNNEGRVRASKQVRLGAIVLDECPLESVSPDQINLAMMAGIRKNGISCLPWDKESEAWVERVRFLHRLSPGDWPDVSEKGLLDSMPTWLGPFLSGMSRREHLQRLELNKALFSLLSWDKQRRLDELAPKQLPVPTGRSVTVDYSNDPPVLAVGVQEMFGQLDTPRIAEGRVPVLLHLLSPARRPVQVTQDLEGFWRNSYKEVKKELKGRYPKHHWPDDPQYAEPATVGKRLA